MLPAQVQRTQISADQSPSFSISIRAPQSTVKLSGEVTIAVRVTNTSDHKLFAPNLAFTVRDSEGKSVPRVQGKPGVPPRGSFVSAPLEHGQSFDSSINLKNEFAITKPGKYTIQAWREDYVLGTNKVRNIIRSNVITIGIVK
jgi:hypothetical protein